MNLLKLGLLSLILAIPSISVGQSNHDILAANESTSSTTQKTIDSQTSSRATAGGQRSENRRTGRHERREHRRTHRHERREHRHERRDDRRTNRHERRDDRRD